MKKFFRELIDNYGFPRVAIVTFLSVLVVMAFIQKQNMPGLVSDAVGRISMNGILVLAMLPSIASGAGLNFGISLGILSGILATCLSIEYNFSGMTGFFVAILISIPIASIAGYFYAQLLNKVKGNEMTVGTYMGFSMVSLMSIGWLVLPFTSREMIWAIGGTGLRTTIDLSNRFGKVLNNFWAINIGDWFIPTGTILFLSLCLLLVWLFTISKTGVAMTATGDNPGFASASGINVNKQRTIGIMLSMVLGGIGIVVYAQSYGFLQLYQAPLMMPFGAVAAILIGGATAKKVSIGNVIIGTVLFQTLLTISLPVINKLLPVGNISELARIIVSNGIILYALSKSGGVDLPNEK